MAEPIKHDLGSSFATAGWKAAKWGFAGTALAIALPAVLLVGAGVAGLAAVSVASFSIGGALGAAVLGTLAAALGYGAVTTAIAVPTTLAAGAVGGGLLGMYRGGKQVSAEEQAYREKVENQAQLGQFGAIKAKTDGEINGYQAGLRDGQAAGFQQGQEFVVNQINQHIAAEQAAASQPQPKVGGFAEKVGCGCASKAETINKEREAQASVQKQI